MSDIVLRYDRAKWQEEVVPACNTLQLFITNRCNLRCRGCFYSHKLGGEEMSLAQYQEAVKPYLGWIQKIILLGGEPTMHSDLPNIIKFNQAQNLKTTIYSNGFDLAPLENLDLTNVKIRIGVYGALSGEKCLAQVKRTTLPVTIVYMLRRDNIDQLAAAAKMAETEFSCTDFYISSIRDIATTGNYWLDTDETILPAEYAGIVQRFVDSYYGGLKRLHLATRGVLVTRQNDFCGTKRCRFGNVFPDGEKIVCPLDISKKLTASELAFGERSCDKHHKCILQKIVLQRL